MKRARFMQDWKTFSRGPDRFRVTFTRVLPICGAANDDLVNQVLEVTLIASPDGKNDEAEIMRYTLPSG